jgi:NAD(P)-dependent dehydrogenase (short-subunit alcohol dehydrogenase family)
MNALGVESAPLQRPGMPIEVAGAYVFLASPLGSYFTGEVIHGTGVCIPPNAYRCWLTQE